MKALLLSLFFIFLLYSQDNFSNYLEKTDKSFAFYKNKELKLWNDFLKSTKTTWVEYDNSNYIRSIVNFKFKEITIDVISQKNDKESIIPKISNRFEKVISKDLNGERVVSDVLSKKEEEFLKSEIVSSNITKSPYNNGLLKYSIKLKLPSDYIVRKAMKYEPIINKYHLKYGIEKGLIYSIIHSESSFNPMSESSVAYGLMQIVPRSAGVDVTKYLYGTESIVSKDFLFNADNNMLFGTTYLYLLKTKHFDKVLLPESKKYCMIAAYNTGPGNLFRTFSKDRDISIVMINSFSHDNLKSYLVKNLPYGETKVYLERVTSRIPQYGELIRLRKL